MKKLILLFASLLFATTIFSQQSPIDSLAQLPIDATISQRTVLFYLIDDYINAVNDPKEKLTTAQQYLKVASTRPDSFYLANSYLQISESYGLLKDSVKQQVYKQKYQAIKNRSRQGFIWELKEKRAPGFIEGLSLIHI